MQTAAATSHPPRGGGKSLWARLFMEPANEQMVAATIWPVLMYGARTGSTMTSRPQGKAALIKDVAGAAKAETVAML